ncbi:MAG: TIGR00296 family protein [Candidatus Micrarchaeota archaeon]
MGGMPEAREGEMAVRGARKALRDALEGREPEDVGGLPVFGEARGVFVSIHTYPAHELRGCIGFPYPLMPLGKALSKAACAAGLEDSRFAPVRAGELDSLVFEVSVLSVPKEMKIREPAARLQALKIGRDGLILEYGRASGLLLPQVPIEWNWNGTQFLEALCEKAGLPRDMWKSASARLFTFQAAVFEEQKPNGKVTLKKMIR